jgi:hypothetical protein
MSNAINVSIKFLIMQQDRMPLCDKVGPNSEFLHFKHGMCQDLWRESGLKNGSPHDPLLSDRLMNGST